MKIWKLKSQCIPFYYTKKTKKFKNILQSLGKDAENETLYPDGEITKYYSHFRKQTAVS